MSCRQWLLNRTSRRFPEGPVARAVIRKDRLLGQPALVAATRRARRFTIGAWGLACRSRAGAALTDHLSLSPLLELCFRLLLFQLSVHLHAIRMIALTFFKQLLQFFRIHLQLPDADSLIEIQAQLSSDGLFILTAHLAGPFVAFRAAPGQFHLSFGQDGAPFGLDLFFHRFKLFLLELLLGNPLGGFALQVGIPAGRHHGAAGR